LLNLTDGAPRAGHRALRRPARTFCPGRPGPGKTHLRIDSRRGQRGGCGL